MRLHKSRGPLATILRRFRLGESRTDSRHGGGADGAAAKWVRRNPVVCGTLWRSLVLAVVTAASVRSSSRYFDAWGKAEDSHAGKRPCGRSGRKGRREEETRPKEKEEGPSKGQRRTHSARCANKRRERHCPGAGPGKLAELQNLRRKPTWLWWRHTARPGIDGARPQTSGTPAPLGMALPETAV